ncbi:MAG: GntR family transcriptional regulator [Trueperaceae bacterium]|nr:GntR family transcriptional regulator [Trueperaceae bacterium]MCO5175254.1 GntR family transcriptional regulator [Trueperaceae bacterium]
MTAGTGTRGARLPLVVGADDYVPMYQQLVHQIRHLITSRVLAADDRLPSVRELARQLGINAGTVALAYRKLHAEGLIASRRGRGTFVVPLSHDLERSVDRHKALQAAIDRLLERANALGFDAASVHQGLVTRPARRRRFPFVVAMASMRGAEKYAAQIVAAVPEEVSAEPHCLTIAELEGNASSARAAYRTAYFTFTFMSHVPGVGASLTALGIESEVVGLTSELTGVTIAGLAALSAEGNYCLVGESYSISVALNVLARFSRLDLSRIRVFTEHDPPEALLTAAPDLYIHTFGAGPRLDELGIGADLRLELRFSLSAEARRRVAQLFRATGAPTTVARTADIILDA